MRTTHYSRKENGKYQLRVYHLQKLLVDIEIDELPPSLRELKMSVNDIDDVDRKMAFRLHSKVVKDTVFDKIGEKLFKLGMNNLEVSELIKQIKKEGEK